MSESVPAGAIPVSSHTELTNAVSANPSGSIFHLTNNMTWNSSQKLPVKTGNQYWGTPGNRPLITGPGPSVIGGHFYSGDVDSVQLHHLRLKNFGPHQLDQNGCVINGQAGVQAFDWVMDTVEVSHTANNLIRWNAGWLVKNCHFHHAGGFAMNGGSAQGVANPSVLEDTEWSYCGVTHDGITAIPTSDRGGSKFAVTNGTNLYRLHSHHNYIGVWWDIACRNGILEDANIHDIERVGIDIEVSYGPFTITRPTLTNIGVNPLPEELQNNWALPPAIIATLTPNVTVTDFTIDGADQGAISHQWAHPQAQNPPLSPFVDITQLGCNNVLFQDGVINNVKNFNSTLRNPYGTLSYSAGQTGSQQPYVLPTCNVNWNNVVYGDASPNFKNMSVPAC